MKNTNKKLKNQSKVVKASFTGSNITRYSVLNTVAKYMNCQDIVKSISSAFPSRRHNATKFGVNQILMAIALASVSGIMRICRIAAFSGDGLVKVLLRLDKAINEDAISASLKGLGQKGARKLQSLFLAKMPDGCAKAGLKTSYWMPVRPSNRFAAIRKGQPRATTPQRRVQKATIRCWFSSAR